ncbi:DinB family protein [Streptomyces sp. XM4193]|uniref:DinB family protein n=1 Tax=Streptomyces sp. XM4193 TaxID=2929782 RepID=UPI001FFBBA29|nr:DinB family protein [Streptomyces sp. XM4193]MCK1796748.1 DinB family protein [Streptomyces sp. XM4193]
MTYTAPERIRPPFTADERDQLSGWLDMQRNIIHFKCAGLSEEAARRSVIPTSPLMTVAGVVAHLRWVEHAWFEVMFLGGSEKENPSFLDDPEDADMRPAADVPLEQLLEEYQAQCARSNEIAAAASLDDTGRRADFKAGQASLRWMLVHMIEETARHAGHLDLIRELLDGETGYF